MAHPMPNTSPWPRCWSGPWEVRVLVVGVGVWLGFLFPAFGCGGVAVIHGTSKRTVVLFAAVRVGVLGFVLAYVFRRATGPFARGFVYKGKSPVLNSILF